MSIKDNVIVENSTLVAGEISIRGFKHAAVVIICCSIYAKFNTIILNNVPHIEDTRILVKIINQLGGNATFNAPYTLKVNTQNLSSHYVPRRLSKLIHGAIYLIPILLARHKKINIGQCGGCQIGESTALGKRPIAHMLKVLEEFGCCFELKNNQLIGRAPENFKPTTIDIMDFSDESKLLTGPRVSGATKTAILAALAVTTGTTIIYNPYLKADVFELLNFVKKLGYKVEYDMKRIVIKGKINSKALISYKLVTDISEVMTYITIACYHHVRLKIKSIQTDKLKLYLATELEYLNKMGIHPQFQKSAIIIKPVDNIKGTNIEVTSLSIYSDHQPFFALLLFAANRPTCIIEKVWQTRFSYAKELLKLGLSSKVADNVLMIKPSEPLQSDQSLRAHDLRAAAVLLIAAIKVPGITKLSGMLHLKRGYDNLTKNLVKLNAKIK